MRTRIYLTLRTKGPTNPRYWGSGAQVQQLIGCIITNLTEDEKAQFTSAGVLLGLMPTILSVLGASTFETSLSLSLAEDLC